VIERARRRCIRRQRELEIEHAASTRSDHGGITIRCSTQLCEPLRQRVAIERGQHAAVRRVAHVHAHRPQWFAAEIGHMQFVDEPERAVFAHRKRRRRHLQVKRLAKRISRARNGHKAGDKEQQHENAELHANRQLSVQGGTR
jgi:hypothetical protein